MAQFEVLISICATYDTLEAPEDGLNVHVLQRRVRDALTSCSTVSGMEIASIGVSRED